MTSGKLPRGRPIIYGDRCKNGHFLSEKTLFFETGSYIHKKNGKRYNTLARRCRFCESDKVKRSRLKSFMLANKHVACEEVL